MSYQVLSRKWRPQLFNEIVGQEHVTITLQNAISMDRVAHGYLFSGPRGVGKTTTARVLAKTLNCKNSIDNNPCNKCTNCHDITHGNNLDVQEFDGASNRGIDEIRDLRETVKYPPNNGKYRIFIIDEVHMLTKEAFNALLKTLEEPPAHVIFIMATTDDHKIPVTIKSRTQKFDFKLISEDEIAKFLNKILENEKIEHDNKGIFQIAQKANGSLRDSLSLLDQVIAYSNEKLNIEMIRDVLGIIEENIFLDLLMLINEKKHAELTNYINDLLNKGYSISNFILGFNEFVRNCMIYKSESSIIHNLSEKSINWLESKCSFTIKDIINILDLSLKFEANLKNLLQPQISLEILFLKIALLKNNIVTPTTVQKKTDNDINIKTNPDTKTNVPLKKEGNVSINIEDHKINLHQNQTNKDLTTLSLDKIKDSWKDFINELAKENTKISHFLEDANLVSYNENKLCIKLLNGNNFQQNSLEKDLPQIESIFKKILNKNIEFEIRLDNISKEKSKKSDEKTEEREHPLFEKVIESFEGEIIR